MSNISLLAWNYGVLPKSSDLGIMKSPAPFK